VKGDRQMATFEQPKRKRESAWPPILSRRYPSGKTGYQIAVMIDGQRIRETFKTKSEAESRAGEIRAERRNMGKAASELSVVQRVEAAKAFEKLAEYPAASLTAAIDYYITRKLQFRESPTVADGVERLVLQMTGRRGRRTVDDLRCRWRKFAAQFGSRQFSEIEASEITRWLDKVATGSETRHNYRRKTVELFNLATAEKWCTDNPAKESRKDDRLPPEPGIFKVEEVARILEHAETFGLMPYVALGAFCGIRVSELTRLDWSNINHPERAVTIEARTTKTKTRRVVYLNDTAAAWLAPRIKKAGPVVDSVGLRERLLDLRKAAGLKRWPTNVLRHSFGSYALSAWQDVAKVSYQMGNSPSVCRRHYEQVVRQSDAVRFWALRPSADGAEKIVQLPVKH
jgi:integrase